MCGNKNCSLCRPSSKELLKNNFVVMSSFHRFCLVTSNRFYRGEGVRKAWLGLQKSSLQKCMNTWRSSSYTCTADGTVHVLQSLSIWDLVNIRAGQVLLNSGKRPKSKNHGIQTIFRTEQSTLAKRICFVWRGEMDEDGFIIMQGIIKWEQNRYR